MEVDGEPWLPRPQEDGCGGNCLGQRSKRKDNFETQVLWLFQDTTSGEASTHSTLVTEEG